jgi:23S rRNA (guanosine2251-2'-O)-methyltransferase
MKRDQRRGSNDRHLIYGVNPVREALHAGRKPREIVIAEGAREERLRELIEVARDSHVPIKRAPRSKLDRDAGGAQHQGVIAYLAASNYADADDLLESISSRPSDDSPALVLVLDGIEDPRNLGAILRTAECAGADGVFIPERRAAGLNEAVAKTSAGAVEHLPVARVTNLTVLIRQLKERNIWVIGTSDDAPVDYCDWDWTRPSAIVLGAEGSGLHRLVRENCDAVVRIPVYGKVQSLNVSVASGIILYEATRQRSIRNKAEH